MPPVHAHILGCKVNYADAQSALGSLPDDPVMPVALVGTCCVTAEGEKQSRKQVRRAARRVGAAGRVYVTGCAARRDPAAFRNLGANVELWDAGDSLSAGLITKAAPDSKLAGDVAVNSSGAEGRRTRYFLKIQDGCSAGCAYCVIPQVRGRPRSVPVKAVLDAATAAVASGFPELVITGINVGCWRDGGTRLPHLLELLAGIPGLKRLRLSSIEAGHVTAELLRIFENYPVVGRHLHVPLQSGDREVLRSMGRSYGPDDYTRIIDRVRENVAGMNITTDVIVGFPAESGAAFGRSLEFVANAGFSKAHVFSFSPRPGTRAAELDDIVPAREKKRRSRLMRDLSDDLQYAHRKRKLRRLSEVLLESPQGQGAHGGYSSDYTRFIIEGGEPGKLVSVRGESVTAEGVWGRLSDYER